MSERQRKASASAGASSGSSSPKRKTRPPPIVVSETQPPSAAPQTFSLPTMRGPNLYNHQQILVTPAAQQWDVQEQTQLERLTRVMCFPNESLLDKSIKVAAHLGKKTVRDVACRLKSMEESTTISNRPQDDIDRFLRRGEAIMAELQSMPAKNRTEEQNARLYALIKEYTAGTRNSKMKLDQKQLKIPVEFIPEPDIPAFLRN